MFLAQKAPIALFVQFFPRQGARQGAHDGRQRDLRRVGLVAEMGEIIRDDAGDGFTPVSRTFVGTLQAGTGQTARSSGSVRLSRTIET